MPSENNLEQQSLPLLSKATGEAILKTTPDVVAGVSINKVFSVVVAADIVNAL